MEEAPKYLSLEQTQQAIVAIEQGQELDALQQKNLLLKLFHQTKEPVDRISQNVQQAVVAIEQGQVLNPLQQRNLLLKLFLQSKEPKSYAYDKESPHPRLAILKALTRNATGLMNGSYDSFYSGDDFEVHPDAAREYGLQALSKNFTETVQLMGSSNPPKDSDLHKDISSLGDSIGNIIIGKFKEDGIQTTALDIEQSKEKTPLSLREETYLDVFREMTVCDGPFYHQGDWIEKHRTNAKFLESRLETKQNVWAEHTRGLEAAQKAAQAEAARLEAERKANTPLKRFLGAPKKAVNFISHALKPKNPHIAHDTSLPGDR